MPTKRFAFSQRSSRQSKWTNLTEYAQTVNPRFVMYRHIEVLFEYLEAVAHGELKRLMIFEPPRHGKSESVSRIFPGYYLHLNPDQWVGLGSYGADLAHDLSRAARDYYERSGGVVRHDKRAANHWLTKGAGGMWSAGVEGTITGKGFHLGIMDDLIKSEIEAASKRIREKTWNWRRVTWGSRREPGAAEILMMTRWHADDPAGRQIEAEEDQPQNWTVLNFASIAPEEPPRFPKTFTVAKDWRKPGEALCPERYDEETLGKIEKELKPYYWSALHMQSPTPEEGTIWKVGWFTAIDRIPSDVRKAEYDWDTAYTSNDANSACAYMYGGLAGDGRPVILDFGFDWKEFDDLINWMKEKPGRHNIEAKASGKSAAQSLKKKGIPAAEVPIQGGVDKEARCRLVTPFASDGIYVYRPLLEKLLHDPKQGLLKVPNGPHDDVSDTLVQMLNRLFLNASKTPRVGGATARAA